MRIFLPAFLSFLLLSGCGLRPVRRAENLLFDLPYVAQTRVEGDLTIGLKALSAPEVHEIFCLPAEIVTNYHVLYVRFLNRSNKPYFVSFHDLPVPIKKDIEPYFLPNTFASMLAQGLLLFPLIGGIRVLAPDPGIAFGATVLMCLGVGFAYEKLSGGEGYQKLFKRVITIDRKNGTPSVVVHPYETRHHLLFLKRSLLAPQDISLSVGRKGELVREVLFDFERLIML